MNIRTRVKKTPTYKIELEGTAAEIEQLRVLLRGGMQAHPGAIRAAATKFLEETDRALKATRQDRLGGFHEVEAPDAEQAEAPTTSRKLPPEAMNALRALRSAVFPEYTVTLTGQSGTYEVILEGVPPSTGQYVTQPTIHRFTGRSAVATAFRAATFVGKGIDFNDRYESYTRGEEQETE